MDQVTIPENLDELTEDQLGLLERELAKKYMNIDRRITTLKSQAGTST